MPHTIYLHPPGTQALGQHDYAISSEATTNTIIK